MGAIAWVLLICIIIIVAALIWSMKPRSHVYPVTVTTLRPGGVRGGNELFRESNPRLGGGRPKHVYNRIWDDEVTFKQVGLDAFANKEGRPLVVIPYRANPKQNRAEHLAIFLQTMGVRLGPGTAFLVAEQSDDDRRFNRGQVINSAIDAFERGAIPELQGFKPTHYIISDVDLIPSLGLAPYYRVVPKKGPLHLAVRARIYEMPTVRGFFGGVNSLTAAQFRSAGGFPNRYWGWGGEDLVFRNRLEKAGYKLHRPKEGYVMNIPHGWGDEAGHGADPDLHRKMSEEKRIQDGMAQVSYVVAETENLARGRPGSSPKMVKVQLELGAFVAKD